MERIDVVCHGPVEEGIAQILGHTVRYQGQVYYFCSEACMDQFRHEPVLYAVRSQVEREEGFGEEAQM